MPEHPTNAQSLQLGLKRNAEDTFESKEDAAQWLQRPHPMLDGASPLQMAQTEAGAERVRDILIAIRYGGVV